jgi:hypothetical protein
MKMDSLEALKAQIALDAAQARHVLGAFPGDAKLPVSSAL